jgi:hypothetical protein
MSDVRPQSFENHRAIPQAFLAVVLILAIDVLVRAWNLIQVPTLGGAWSVIAGAALVVGFFVVRRAALTVQDRVIRLEMRQRLERVLGAEKNVAIQSLSLAQLVSLRFASDAELPALVDAVRSENLTNRDEIKKRIKDWQADWLRV